jgi:hypothetical protein
LSMYPAPKMHGCWRAGAHMWLRASIAARLSEAIAMCTGYGRGPEFTKLESVKQLRVSPFCFKGYLTIRKRSTKFQRILSEQSRIKAICLHATMCSVNYDCGCPVRSAPCFASPPGHPLSRPPRRVPTRVRAVARALFLDAVGSIKFRAGR